LIQSQEFYGKAIFSKGINWQVINGKMDQNQTDWSVIYVLKATAAIPTAELTAYNFSWMI